jgi:DNA-binding LytR/AlgR family response regulator
MEDHYVRAHTAAGSDLVLMRMRDAVAELGGLAGLQVHRSWWVAEAAVAGHRRNGRQLSLTLKNGLEAPVARSAEAAVRAAGWLNRR